MNKRFNFFLILAGCVFLTWLVFPRLLQRIWGDGTQALVQVLTDAGPVGDSFGALNSLFTGLALAALVYAILVQVEQLKRQEENLALYKEEVEKTIAHLEKEDRWNRLKLKMEVLPHLSQRAEHRIGAALARVNHTRIRGDNAWLINRPDDSAGFSRSVPATEKLRDWIGNRISEVQDALEECRERVDATKADLDKWAANRLRIDGLTYDDSPELLESAKETSAMLSADAMDRVRDSLAESEADLAAWETVRSLLESALEDAEQLLAYQADLEAAYHEARRA